MQNQITFTRFEIQARAFSPNAVIGYFNEEINGQIKERGAFISSPATALGKALGDQIALQIKAAMEREYINPTLRVKPFETPQIECSDCHHIQDLAYPMTGKLYCQGCGELLDQIVA